MTMFQSDLSVLLGPFSIGLGHRVPVVGLARMVTANGEVTRSVIEVEVTLLDDNRQRMFAWTRTFCNLVPGAWAPGEAPRLDGPIVLDSLYVASVPNGIPEVYVSTTRHELPLPDLNLAINPGQHNPSLRNRLPPLTVFAQTHGPLFPAVGGKLVFPPPAPGVP